MRSATWRARSTLIPVALLALAACGCNSTHVTRVARFEPARLVKAVFKPAPQSAAYKVKYADASGDGLKTVGGTKRIVRRGDALGFTTSPDGEVIAVAGDERFPLDKLPESARYCVWVARDERPTQFSREIGKAATTAAAITFVSAVVAGAVSMEIVEAQLDDDDDDCDDAKDEKDFAWLEGAGHIIREVFPPKGKSSGRKNKAWSR